jgi:hypothetical protein
MRGVVVGFCAVTDQTKAKTKKTGVWLSKVLPIIHASWKRHLVVKGKPHRCKRNEDSKALFVQLSFSSWWTIQVRKVFALLVAPTPAFESMWLAAE